MLLTRSPLYSSPCGDFPVRLACVRHAASVDSEPGSNSHLKPESVWVDRRPPSAVTKVLSCEYVQTFDPNICFSRLARSTFCQRPIRFPPERCAFSPPDSFAESKSFAGFWASSKLGKAIALRRPLSTRCGHRISNLFSTACSTQ